MNKIFALNPDYVDDPSLFQLHFNKYHPTVTLEDYYENFIRGKKGANVGAQAKTSTPKVAVKRERTESGTSVFSLGGLSGISDPPATRTLNDSGLEADLSLVKQVQYIMISYLMSNYCILL